MRQPRAAQRTNGAQRAHPTLATVSTADVAHTRPVAVLHGAAHVARSSRVGSRSASGWGQLVVFMYLRHKRWALMKWPARRRAVPRAQRLYATKKAGIPARPRPRAVRRRGHRRRLAATRSPLRGPARARRGHGTRDMMVIVDINRHQRWSRPHRDLSASIFCSGLAETPTETAAHEKRLGWPIGRAGLQVWSGVSPSRVHLYPYRRSAVPSSLRFALSLCISSIVSRSRSRSRRRPRRLPPKLPLSPHAPAAIRILDLVPSRAISDSISRHLARSQL